MRKLLLIYVILVISPLFCFAQNLVKIPFGDFEQWKIRHIKESYLIGGQTKTVYAIAPTDTVNGTVPYRPTLSPWSSSNVLAIVSKIVKTSNTVFPEKRNKGYCTKLITSLVKCKVFGLINIKVLASGSIFLGETIEPITSTKNPYMKMDMGIPFRDKPKNLVFDYKANISQSHSLTKANGLFTKILKGDDKATVLVLLQHRWENKEGQVFAKRIGTAFMTIGKTTPEWVNRYKLPIHYGQLFPNNKNYVPLSKTYYCRNKSGRMVPIEEIGWNSNKNEAVTHIIVMFSSGNQGAYIGSIGNKLLLDNVCFEK